MKNIFTKNVIPKTFKANLILFVVSGIYVWGGIGYYLRPLGDSLVLIIQLAGIALFILSILGIIDTGIKNLRRNR